MPKIVCYKINIGNQVTLIRDVCAYKVSIEDWSLSKVKKVLLDKLRQKRLPIPLKKRVKKCD